MPFDGAQEAIEIVGETEFYRFDFGNLVEFYTSASKQITAFGETWTPLPILREGRQLEKEHADRVRILLPVRKPFVTMVVEAGLEAVGLRIIRGFGRNYAVDYRNPWFNGFLIDIEVGTTVVRGNLESVETLFETRLPRVFYQSACNNTLYGPVCGVDPTPYIETRTVTNIASNGRLITLSGSIPATDYFTFGRMWKFGETSRRAITKQAGNLFVLHVPISGLVVGDAVDILPGCDKFMSTCRLKFNNRSRAVAMNLIPSVNPIIDGV